MVRIYYEGQTVVVVHAIDADVQELVAREGRGRGPGVVCYDKEKNVVAQFRLDKIVGYSIDPAE